MRAFLYKFAHLGGKSLPSPDLVVVQRWLGDLYRRYLRPEIIFA